MRIHVIPPETSACCWLNTYGRVISAPQNEDELLTIFSTQEMPVRYVYGPFDDTATVCHCEVDGSPGINSVAGMSTQDEDSVPLLTPYFLHLIIEAPTP